MTEDALLELLRPHIRKLLADDELTNFELIGRLEEADGTWDISRRGMSQPKVIRKLQQKAGRLTARN